MTRQRGGYPVLVLGAGDVGSAVAHALFHAGRAVVLQDGPAPPAAAHRGMAFADAFFDGKAMLAGVTARRLGSPPADLPAALGGAASLPFLAGTVAEALAAAPWAAVVDARMRKRAAPEDLRAWAPLTVGLGPGFAAGGGPDANCHVAARCCTGRPVGPLRIAWKGASPRRSRGRPPCRSKPMPTAGTASRGSGTG